MLQDPILEFIVEGGEIIDIKISAFPLPEEWFLWFSVVSIPIQDEKFIFIIASSPETSGQGEFILEGTFTADNKFTGTMTFQEGFFWVDFMLEEEVTFIWTAELQ
ncbi:MAG: hypothetical protein A2Z15_02855 [Chloroflexi bacterium RBG_16_50_11]|nr:MAG: hypothetical protein A2Z15_02855 [Chloroflexi bacterium RBG_16_50_11]